MSDPIKAPQHYTGGDIEPKDLILAGCFPHYVASAIEYIWRHKRKNGAEDLRKAAQCLRMHTEALDQSENYKTHVKVCCALDRSTSEQWQAFNEAAGFYVGYDDYIHDVILALEIEAKKYEAQQGASHA